MLENLNIFLSAPNLWVQTIVNGVAIGSIFALVAYGMALIWGVTKIINIAQGEFVILGGYLTYILYANGIPPLLGLLLAPIILFALGYTLYHLIIFRIIKRDLFISILATFGISIIIQQAMNSIFGPDVQIVDARFGSLSFLNDQLIIPYARIISFLLCGLTAIALILFMRNTKTGKAIRATAQNPQAAHILGIDTNRIYAITFAINSAICGMAGFLVVLNLAIHPYIGLPYTIRSFMIVIIAGLGNLVGVILSGVGLGIVEEFADYTLGSEFRLAIIFLLLIVILIVRGQILKRKRQYLE